MRAVLLLAISTLTCAAQQSPEIRSWILTSSANEAVRAIAPDVHSVSASENLVHVESAGLSLHSFGSLEANQYDPPLGPRKVTFEIPRHPRPASGEHMSAPLGIVGVFVTGVPIYNPIGTASYRDQNIWHLDAVGASKAGNSQLVAALNANASRHSPIIGFALDGYPIYGPYGWDAAGNIKRMTSSYHLRSISKRTTLPDGTLLTPGQEGPDLSDGFPLGTFAEDYEFVPHSGDLDEFNGRLARTPEYPNGTYAYFLATWPYLIGPRYYGNPTLPQPAKIFADHPKAGEPATLTLNIHDRHGKPVRFLEKVHEQPIHLIVVSDDLTEFAHIHPHPAPGDVFTVAHTFAHGGSYTAYADYTPPGGAPVVEKFAIDVAGPKLPPSRLCLDSQFTKAAGGVAVTMHAPRKIRAGEDVALSFDLTARDLEPWLGAWAHIMLISQNRATFIHAHPQENAASASDPLVHVHLAPVAGPSPETIRTVTGFREPGLYKLWFQFQRGGKVTTIPWVVNVEPSNRGVSAAVHSDVIVSSRGFEPARLTIHANQTSRITFLRTDAQNCASEVVFPDLRIKEKLPVGETVSIDIPARKAGELHFACGMGMYRGALILR